MGLGGGGEGLGCVGRGARCSARNSGRSLGVTAALDPTQRRADALCQIRVVSAGKKKAPPSPKPQQQKNPTWNYKEAMIGRRFPNLSCVKEFGSGNESNKPTRKNR